MHSIVSDDRCELPHSTASTVLTSAILVGLVISYVPQLARIINKKTSEGFSPWYLLLGATSSASGMLNVMVVQFPLFQCCKVLTAGRCLENLLGFLQVAIQWFLFSCILVLYLVYFPAHLKYQRTLPISSAPSSIYGATANASHTPNHLTDDGESIQEAGDGTLHESIHGVIQPQPLPVKVSTTPEWRVAVTVAVVCVLHVALLFALALALLLTLHSTPTPHPLIQYLALFLGISGTILAIAQYAPQLVRTYRIKLVGALSIPTMLVQVPGAVFFILSLMSRPGVTWMSVGPYAVTAAMQAMLLVLCLVYRKRQKDNRIDDFGNPLAPADPGTADEQTALL